MENCLNLQSYLISGVDVYIKLFRSASPFIFLSEEPIPDYKLKILDVVFKCATVTLDPGVNLNHKKQIHETPARYLINRSHVTQNVIPKGSIEFFWDSMFPKALPSKVVFGPVSQKAANGDYTTNPFNFQDFNMFEVNRKINGVDIYGSPLKLDFGDSRNYTTAYVRRFDICEKWNKDAGLSISLGRKGYTLIGFSFEPNDFQEDFLNLVKHDHARLEMRFKQPIFEIITMMQPMQALQ